MNRIDSRNHEANMPKLPKLGNSPRNLNRLKTTNDRKLYNGGLSVENLKSF